MRVAAVALAFSTTGVPTVTLVVRPDSVTLLPFSWRVPVELAPNVTATGVVAFKASALPNCTTPAPIARPPVKVLAPDRIKVPRPVLDSEVLPPITPLNVLVLAKAGFTVKVAGLELVTLPV